MPYARSTLFALVLAAACLPLPAHAAETSRPNILFIAIDDLNDWVEILQGHPQTRTPNMARLAQRGVVFTGAHCNVPICSPSRTSLMTGKYPFHTGVFTNGESVFQLRGKFTTLPEHFAKQGYRTLGAGKLFHGSSGKYRQFFQEYGPGSGNQGGPFTRQELNTLNQNPTYKVDRGEGKLQAVLPLNRMPDDRRTGKARNNSFDWGPVDVPTGDMPDGEVAAWAAQQLGGKFQKPFFLGVGFYRPHQPLFAPKKYFAPFPFAETKLPPTRESDLSDLSWYARELAVLPLTAGRHATVVKHQQWRPAVASYLACVHFVDDLLGQVLDALDESPYSDNTLIVLWSDHGYHLGEKQHWGKFTPWRESTRVPMIIVPPRSMQLEGFEAGTACNRPVSLIDLYPTLVDLCGLPQPHELDGRSLRPLLRQPQSEWPHPALTAVGRGTFSVCGQNHRYIRYFDGSDELYDLTADPREWNNLAGQAEHADVQQRLARFIPPEPDVAHYVRQGKWKGVFFADSKQQPLLFEVVPGTGSGGGIGETQSVANRHPQVVDGMRKYLQSHPDAGKRVLIPAADN